MTQPTQRDLEEARKTLGQLISDSMEDIPAFRDLRRRQTLVIAQALAQARADGAAEEREACVKIAEDTAINQAKWEQTYIKNHQRDEQMRCNGGYCSACDIAAAIRARGNEGRK